MSQPITHYTTTYSHFDAETYEQIRRETFGEDIGQNSWLTADNLRAYAAWLGIKSTTHVLDIGCGSGGPTLFIASMTDARMTGIDINWHGIAQAMRAAQNRQMTDRVQFQQADASQRLPFEDATFDAVLCIDAISHLPNRPEVFNDWYRILKPGGLVLFSDPIIVTGLLSNEEIAIRSSIASFLFAPPGEDIRLIREVGFKLERQEDTTLDTATLSQNWLKARDLHRAELLAVEGDQTFARRQRFYAMVHKLSWEQRLSRFVFLARKASDEN